MPWLTARLYVRFKRSMSFRLLDRKSTSSNDPRISETIKPLMMAMITSTTINSISVKPFTRGAPASRRHVPGMKQPCRRDAGAPSLSASFLRIDFLSLTNSLYQRSGLRLHQRRQLRATKYQNSRYDVARVNGIGKDCPRDRPAEVLHKALATFCLHQPALRPTP